MGFCLLEIKYNAHNVILREAKRARDLRPKPEKTECTKGLHPWTEENKVYIKSSDRNRVECRECRKARRESVRDKIAA